MKKYIGKCIYNITFDFTWWRITLMDRPKEWWDSLTKQEKATWGAGFLAPLGAIILAIATMM